MSLPIILGISGASGAVYGLELLRTLAATEVPVHLIVSQAALRTIEIETDVRPDDVTALADHVHDASNMAAPVASGSFRTRGMIVAPCSIKTLSGIAHSYTDTLLVRAADVCLKEKRRLVLMVRETPLHQGHLEMMARVAGLGATILPPIPAFYHRPQTIDDIVRQSVGKALDQFEIDHDLFERWIGA
ncbi:UbiX family flavin prenyltransferase [Magnetospira sp. QH-2]|uniref:UbiX family flavin prenyltransferase n=1 Tax=Magnetospira sp. (strain QH-2) TaxID=1288970 RepID=UPI0003E80EE3|nr:UbiX family flavin prenyltransferase [Magnetospira sp. QH-2]CCQ73528.1 3-octaprenyl-4-hydroxybenzoate carboxy-lyase [Magnetospira sp. QH-2]